MDQAFYERTGKRLDRACLWAAAAFPVALALGNVFFEASVAATGIFWLARAAVRQENPVGGLRGNPLVLPWLCFCAAILLSLAVNGPGSKGWAHDVASVRFLLFGLAILDLSRREPVERYMVAGLAAGICTAAANTALAYAVGHDIFFRPLSRYTGKLQDADRIVGIVAYGAPMFFAWALADSSLSAKRRAGVMVVALIAMANLFQIGARTPMIASFAGTVFVVLLLMARMKKAAWGLAVLALFGAGAVAAASAKHLWHLFSFYDRIYIWRVSAGMFYEHPILGVGVGSFREAYAHMAASGAIEPFVSPAGRVYAAAEQTHSHNLYLMLLSSTGLLGFLSFFWLFFAAAFVARKKTGGFRAGFMAIPAVMLTAGIAGENLYYSTYLSLVSFLFALMGAQSGRDAVAQPAYTPTKGLSDG
ncbi:MAG: O-antigen ligase family protein [Thermodesulfobacteriota bacterium]